MAGTTETVGGLVIAMLSVGLSFGEYCQAKEQAKQTYVTRQYEESVKEVCNPERGFYIQADVTDVHTHEQNYESYYRLRLLTFDLNGLQACEYIPEEKLTELRNALEAYREQGLNVIFRAGYCFAEGKMSEPAKFAYIENHCRQICQVLNEYSDVVLVVQAGFIGPFGEWHTSPYMKQTDEQGEKRPMALLKILTSHLDETIKVAVRSPMYLREAIACGVPKERLCYHNDAFLASDTDMGTYEAEGYSRAEELEWVDENLLDSINGGETTNLSAYTDIENAIYEMDLLDFSYLNRYYSQDVLDYWKTVSFGPQSAFTYINNHLGYRLYLQEFSIQEQLYEDQWATLSGTVENTGFAKPGEHFSLYVVVKGAASEEIFVTESAFVGEERLPFACPIFIWDAFETEERIQIGLCMTKEIDNRENNSIEFANDTLVYEDGIHWIATYEKEGEGSFADPIRFVLCPEGR